MPQTPMRAYPENYTPADLDFAASFRFESREGQVFRLPDDPLIAGTAGTWIIEIENHARDLPAGAVINLVRFNYQVLFKMQVDKPQARDYCTLETDSQAKLNLIPGRSSVNLWSLVVESGVFRQGESLQVRLGDRRWGSVGSEIFWSATEGAFLLAVDPAGKGEFQGVAGNPYSLKVIAHTEVDLLRLLGPTIARPGEAFDLHLGVFDRNRNLIEDFSGEIVFDAPEEIMGLPERYRFQPEDKGIKIFEGVTLSQPGVYRIGLSRPEDEKTFQSNPILVQTEPENYIYWGDVHAHGWGDSTMHLMFLRSDKLDPLSRHQQGRRIGRFDFACPAAMSMDPNKRTEVWEAYRQACAQMDAPGRYVPFLAYEAHPNMPPAAGDRQVIFKHYEDEPIPPPMRTTPIEDLDEHYGRRDDILLQVHIGGVPPIWDRYKPERERFIEVCSGFGCAEWLLQKGLQLGYKPAICGASDLHLGLMGGPRAVETFRGRFAYQYPMNQRDSGYGTGPLTAIIAPQLNREALWTAIETHQTYATSGARIYLDLRCNGQPAGGDLRLGTGLELTFTCHGTALIDQIDLIVGEYCLKSWFPDQLNVSETIQFRPDELPGQWVYLRVHQVDGEYAWSTPTWLQRAELLPDPGNLPYWNKHEAIDLTAVGPTPARDYLDDVERYLSLEEVRTDFQELTPIDILDLSMGRCALFYCYWREERIPMSIRWFFEFEIPKIRYDLGWRDFGAYDELDWTSRLTVKQ